MKKDRNYTNESFVGYRDRYKQSQLGDVDEERSGNSYELEEFKRIVYEEVVLLCVGLWR